ncbi:MAG: CoA ester lyase [Chloroflexi bacterium]|nr:CoA ester lyase [Chloroflexota bacterium]
MAVDYVPSSIMPAVLRSVMYTPGSNPQLLEKARFFTADVVVVDLEDSVAPAEKLNAREIAKEWIPRVADSGGDVYVRVNGLDTGLLHGDLEAVVQPALNGIVFPKAEGPDDIAYVDKKLTELEMLRGLPVGHTKIQCIVETGKGVWNAYWTGTANYRINSLVFGAVDYTRDMRVTLTKEADEQYFARSQVAVAARGAHVVAIDPPWAFFTDVEGFIKDCDKGRQMGYEGRMLIHPNQIEPSHKHYAPPEDRVALAREQIAAFEEGMRQGKGSVPLKGGMVDYPVYRAARDLMDKVERIAAKDREKAAKRKV